MTGGAEGGLWKCFDIPKAWCTPALLGSQNWSPEFGRFHVKAMSLGKKSTGRKTECLGGPPCEAGLQPSCEDKAGSAWSEGGEGFIIYVCIYHQALHRNYKVWCVDYI